MDFKRALYPALLDHLPRQQITVLAGMRRTGKTTLLKQLVADSGIMQKFYFDLERLDNRALFSENHEVILSVLRHRGANLREQLLIALDEIQLVPNLAELIRPLYDSYDIKFILAGSNSLYIKKLSESLTGRKKVFEVFPLSFPELLAYNGIKAPESSIEESANFITAEYERLNYYYDLYIQFGGFPEVVFAKTPAEKEDLLKDILSSCINRDSSLLSDVRSPLNLYKLIRLLSAHIGTKLDISRLSGLSGISRATVEHYIDLLEKCYLVRSVPVFSTNSGREITKARKVYFLDNGIASISGDPGAAAKFENAVFNQLSNKGEITYYQLKTGREIDFVVDKKHSFEVKETATEQDLKTIRSLSRNLEINTCYVIGRQPVKIFEGFIWGGMIS